MNPSDSTDETDTSTKPLTLWQVCKSVGAALFGVQTEKARLRDFSQHNPMPFIVVGVVFILAFVVTIAMIVRLVLSAAG